jgi:hypothetical protein
MKTTNVVRNEEAVITVVNKKHGRTGKRGQSLSLLKSKQTVGQFKAALIAADLATYAGYALKTALAEKFITLNTAKKVTNASAKKTAKGTPATPATPVTHPVAA